MEFTKGALPEISAEVFARSASLPPLDKGIGGMVIVGVLGLLALGIVALVDSEHKLVKEK